MSAKNAAASLIVKPTTSAIERPPILRPSDSGRSREPRQAGPRRQRALLERALGVRHQALGIDLPAAAETRARLARAVGAVEREHARRHFRERDSTLGAGQALREEHGLRVFRGWRFD